MVASDIKKLLTSSNTVTLEELCSILEDVSIHLVDTHDVMLLNQIWTVDLWSALCHSLSTSFVHSPECALHASNAIKSVSSWNIFMKHRSVLVKISQLLLKWFEYHAKQEKIMRNSYDILQVIVKYGLESEGLSKYVVDSVVNSINQNLPLQQQLIAISMMAMSSQYYQKIFSELDACNIILDLLSNFITHVKFSEETASKTNLYLKTLACLACSENSKLSLQNEHVIDTVHRVLEWGAQNCTIVKLCCRLLINLFNNNGDFNNTNILQQLKIIVLAVNKFYRDDKSLAYAGVWIISIVACTCEDLNELANLNVCKLVVDICRCYPQEVSLGEKSIAAISALARDKNCCLQLGESACTVVLFWLNKEGPTSVACAAICLAALDALTCCESVRDQLAVLGAGAHIINTLNIHCVGELQHDSETRDSASHMSTVGRYGLFALGNLALCQDTSAVTGARELVLRLLRQHYAPEIVAGIGVGTSSRAQDTAATVADLHVDHNLNRIDLHCVLRNALRLLLLLNQRQHCAAAVVAAALDDNCSAAGDLSFACGLCVLLLQSGPARQLQSQSLTDVAVQTLITFMTIWPVQTRELLVSLDTVRLLSLILAPDTIAHAKSNPRGNKLTSPALHAAMKRPAGKISQTCVRDDNDVHHVDEAAGHDCKKTVTAKYATRLTELLSS